MIVSAPPVRHEDHDPVHRPLSASRLWRQQRDYFEAQGPLAWATGTVPHQVTCSPDMARAIAEVVIGFATDRAHAAGHRTLRPLHLVELGAGAGRLGYHIVRFLRDAVDLAALGWRPVYVLTDLAEATVTWWQSHPWLAPFVQAGLLDFARYDVTADDAIELRVSGRRLSAAQPTDALVVIANYVFDGLPHDAFEAEDGALHEWLVADDDSAYGGDEVTWEGAGWQRTPVRGPRYADPVHQQVLDAHRGLRGIFSLPSGALAALDRVRALSRGPLLVLSADKGAVDAATAVSPDLPAIVRHGSISMDVNYHAIGLWTLAHGGTWMHADHRGRALEVCAFVLGAGRATDHPATVGAFERSIARRGPDDLHALKRTLVAHAGELGLEELLAYLRLSGHDPRIFMACAPAIRAAAERADRATRADLLRALARVWDAYLPIGEPADVAFAIGSLVFELGQPRAARPLLEASRRLHGDRPELAALLQRCPPPPPPADTLAPLW